MRLVGLLMGRCFERLVDRRQKEGMAQRSRRLVNKVFGRLYLYSYMSARGRRGVLTAAAGARKEASLGSSQHGGLGETK